MFSDDDELEQQILALLHSAFAGSDQLQNYADHSSYVTEAMPLPLQSVYQVELDQ